MTPLEIEQKAPLPSAIYPDATGLDFVMSEMLKDGPLLLGIYKSSCAASKAMMPALELCETVYGADGLTVIGVSQDSANVTRSFIRRSELTYPVLIEGDAYPVSVAFDIFATPSIFLVRTDGNIAYTTMGFFRQQIAELSTAIATELGVETRTLIPEENDTFPFFVPG